MATGNLERLIPMNEQSGWIVFFEPGEKEILRISRKGLAEDEIDNTISLLAYECGLSAGEISFAEVVI